MKEDLEAGLIEQSDEIRADSNESAARSAIAYVAQKELVELVLDWKPVELEQVNDES